MEAFVKFSVNGVPVTLEASEVPFFSLFLFKCMLQFKYGMCDEMYLLVDWLPSFRKIHNPYTHIYIHKCKQGHPGGDVTPLFIPKDDDIYPTLTLHSPNTQARGWFGCWGTMYTDRHLISIETNQRPQHSLISQPHHQSSSSLSGAGPVLLGRHPPPAPHHHRRPARYGYKCIYIHLARLGARGWFAGSVCVYPRV